MIIEIYWDDLKFQWGQTLTLCQRPRKRREQAFQEEAEKKHLTSESWHSNGIQKHTEHIRNTHNISDIMSEVHLQYSSVPFHDHIWDNQLNDLRLHASHTQKEALPHGIQCIYRSHWQFGILQFWSMAAWLRVAMCGPLAQELECLLKNGCRNLKHVTTMTCLGAILLLIGTWCGRYVVATLDKDPGTYPSALWYCSRVISGN